VNDDLAIKHFETALALTKSPSNRATIRKNLEALK
jgi:hypothetical protein